MLDEEWAGAMDIRAMVVIDALTGGIVGGSIDMFVCVEIIVVTAVDIVLEFIEPAGGVIDIGHDAVIDMRLISCCCLPMTILDCDCALQALTPSDHL